MTTTQTAGQELKSLNARAVAEVLGGAPVADVAARFDRSPRTIEQMVWIAQASSSTEAPRCVN